jgi:hypothetical protein
LFANFLWPFSGQLHGRFLLAGGDGPGLQHSSVKHLKIKNSVKDLKIKMFFFRKTFKN